MPSTLVQLGVVFGLVLLAAGVGITGLGTWPGLPEPKGPLSLMFLGLICVVSGAVWYFSTSRAVSNVAAPASSELDYKFTLHCDWGIFQDFDRTDGKKVINQMITFVPQDSEKPYIGSGAYSSTGSSYRAIHPAAAGYKCFIRNDSDQIVTGVYATLEIWFKSLTKTKDGQEQWSTIYSGNLDTPILTLRPFEEDYSLLSNISEYYVSLRLPKEINVRVAGAGKYQSVKLTPNDNDVLDVLALGPRPEITNPPSPALQDPAPLVLPEKK